MAPLDKLHAEVALRLALADLVDGNDAWMLEVGGGFCFPPKAFQMRFAGPRAEADHLQRDCAIETFLARVFSSKRNVAFVTQVTPLKFFDAYQSSARAGSLESQRTRE